MQGMSQIREAYFISFRGEINQKNMEERENKMKQKKTGISAEKQEYPQKNRNNGFCKENT